MSIGQQLRKVREGRLISLEQVAQATRIRVHYLKSLEADDFSALPSVAQTRGFLRAYARYLKLDAEPLLAILDGEPEPEVPSPAPVEEPKAAPPVEGTADAIFAEIGQKLRSQRELLGLSVEDVERHTHIRLHYIQALEAGDLAGLPSPVQGKGMLNNYAGFLNLDVDDLLLRFADGLQARRAMRQPPRQDKRPAARRFPTRPSMLQRLFSADLIIGTFLIVFLVAFTAWATLRVSALRSGQEPETTAPSIADILVASATPSPSATASLPDSTAQMTAAEMTLVAVEGTPAPAVEPGTAEAGDATPAETPPTPIPDYSTSPLQVYVIASQRAWMRVTVDGEVAFEGRVLAGSAYPFAGKERIIILTGNGAGLQVIFNQQDLGTLGMFEEVVERIFTLQGVQTPTPAVSPTPTPGPTDTPTPEASSTLQP
jgi:cytoskeleton protein RodZ